MVRSISDAYINAIDVSRLLVGRSSVAIVKEVTERVSVYIHREVTKTLLGQVSYVCLQRDWQTGKRRYILKDRYINKERRTCRKIGRWTDTLLLTYRDGNCASRSGTAGSLTVAHLRLPAVPLRGNSERINYSNNNSCRFYTDQTDSDGKINDSAKSDGFSLER